MESEIEKLKKNMDVWIKELSEEVNKLKADIHLVKENQQNINHNYELIDNLDDEIIELKVDMNLMKQLATMHLREKNQTKQKTIQ